MYGIVKLLIPIWLLGTVVLLFVAFSHLLFSEIMENGDEKGERLSNFGIRVFCAIFWPLMMISIPGRKFIFTGVKALF